VNGNSYSPSAIAVDPVSNRVYVLCGSDGLHYDVSTWQGVISVVDGATKEVVTTIPVGRSGGERSRIAFVRQIGRLYTLNPGDKSLSFIDTGLNHVVTTVKDVTNFAADPATGRVFVAAPGSLRILDGKDGSELASAALGPKAAIEAMAYAAKSNRLYLARREEESRALDVFDGQTLARVNSLPQRYVPSDLAFDASSGYLFVVSPSLDKPEVLVVDPAKDAVVKRLDLGGEFQTNRLAVDELGGRLYVSREIYEKTGVLIFDTKTFKLLADVRTEHGVRAVAVDPQSGRFYTVDGEKNLLGVWDAATQKSLGEIPLGVEVEGLAVDAKATRLFIADSLTRVHVIDLQSLKEVTMVDGGAPLAIDSDANLLYVAAPDGKSTSIIDTKTWKSVGTLPQQGPMAIDPMSGLVYLVDEGVYIADGRKGKIIDKLEKTFPVPRGMSPNPYAVDVALDPVAQRLYVAMNNGVPGSNNGTTLLVYDTRTRKEIASDGERSIGSLIADPTAGRAYLTRWWFDKHSLAVIDSQGHEVMRLFGIAGDLALDSQRHRLYVMRRVGDGQQLAVYDTRSDSLVAAVALDEKDEHLAVDPATGRLFVSGGAGKVRLLEEGAAELQALAAPGLLPTKPVTALASAADTLFAVVDGRLYRSRDAGKMWQRSEIGLPGQTVVAVVTSPTFDRDHTAFVAMGAYGPYGTGIFKTTDGGDTWAMANVGLGDLAVFALVPSPSFAQDGAIFALTQRGGLYKSTDGGGHWSSLKQRATALALAPNFAAEPIAFLGVGGDRSDLLVSADGGSTWKSAAVGLPPDTYLYASGVLSVSPDFTHDRTVFAALGSHGVWRTTDAGASWQAVNGGLISPEADLMAMLVSPDFARDRTVFALSRSYRLWRSTDGGSNWQALRTDALGGELPNSLALSPDHVLLAGTDKGRIVPLVVDKAAWERVGNDLVGVEVQDIAISPDFATDRTVFVASSQAGVFRSSDLGRTWEEVGFPYRGSSIDTLRIAISPGFRDDHTLFVATDGGVYRSTDGGKTWQTANSGFPSSGLNVLSIAVSPNFVSDRTLLVGADYPSQGLRKSSDGGGNWKLAMEAPKKSEGGFANVSAVAFSPAFASDKTAFAWFEEVGLYKSTDGGKTWTPTTKELLTETPQSFAVSPDFTHDRTIWVGTLYGDLSKSTDGGSTWRSTTTGLPDGMMWLKALAVSPAFVSDRTVFAGTDVGVWKSTDGGERWQPASTGLATTKEDNKPREVLALAISPNYASDRTVFAGIYHTGEEHEIGLYRSVDGGASWQPATAEPKTVATAIPRATATLAPIVSPTPCAATPVGFAVAWESRRSKLGCATSSESATLMAVEQFQHGIMFWREDMRRIYVLSEDGTWQSFIDTWESPQQESGYFTPPSGLVEPRRGFGKVWRDQLGGPKSRIGWATEEERGYAGLAQGFEHGTLLRDLDGTVYALYADKTWEVLGK
jgi:DNA-binding beta-propeller fold protein YncE